MLLGACVHLLCIVTVDRRKGVLKITTCSVLNSLFVFVAMLLGVRLEEFVYEKVQGKRPILMTDEDFLGQYMVQAGEQFDSNTPYGMSHTLHHELIPFLK